MLDFGALTLAFVVGAWAFMTSVMLGDRLWPAPTMTWTTSPGKTVTEA